MALRQLGSRLAPRLLQTGELAAFFHSSSAAQGVGIPERKHAQAFLGLHEGGFLALRRRLNHFD